jgi:signal transduction histidine kinase
MREAAESASRAKDRLLAALSRELRGPLMPVFMSLSLLQKDGYVTRMHGPHLKRMERNLKLEERLINDLLDLSRILHQRLELRSELLAIHSLLRCLAEQHQMDAAKRSQQIHLSLNAQSDCIVGDGDRIRQALSNLLSNAVKFSSPGGVTQVRTSEKDDLFVVEVQDKGQGIRSEMLQSVFEPFEPGKARAGIDGLGLGLAITKEIILAHGGNLRLVRSKMLSQKPGWEQFILNYIIGSRRLPKRMVQPYGERCPGATATCKHPNCGATISPDLPPLQGLEIFL